MKDHLQFYAHGWLLHKGKLGVHACYIRAS